MSLQEVNYSRRCSWACVRVCAWNSASFVTWSDLDAWEWAVGEGRRVVWRGGGRERCNISLSSPLFCGFPLSPDALLYGAYSSRASLCVHVSKPLSFMCGACVYTGSDTKTTPEHSSDLNGIISCSCTEIGKDRVKKSMSKELNQWVWMWEPDLMGCNFVMLQMHHITNSWG